jgi:DNA-binding NtrC family response regulator
MRKWIVLESFRLIMQIKDYYVKLALQAKDALDIMEDEKFNIIFSGLKMPPGMDGMEFLKIVEQKYPDTEFIMVTAYEDKNTRAQAIALGALEYLRKPFLMEEIYELVERAKRRIKAKKGQGNA